jgi:hypothetical protein
VSTAPFDVSGALFNADVGNAATVIIIMLVAVGWVIAVIERRNPHLGSVSRGSYWGLMMFLNAADEGPNSVRHAGSAAKRRRADFMHCRASLAAHGSHSEDHLAYEQCDQPVHHHIHHQRQAHHRGAGGEAHPEAGRHHGRALHRVCVRACASCAACARAC